MKTAGVILARYAASRFEGKPLVDIRGKPMIQHVYEQSSRARTMDEVVVATDDSRIYEAVEVFGGNVEAVLHETPFRVTFRRFDDLRQNELSGNRVADRRHQRPELESVRKRADRQPNFMQARSKTGKRSSGSCLTLGVPQRLDRESKKVPRFTYT